MQRNIMSAAALLIVSVGGCTVLAGLDNEYIFDAWIDMNGTNGDAGPGGGTGGGGEVGGEQLCIPGATMPCYSGLAGTEGVGQCKPGVKECSADGSSFGECIGAITPSVEDCSTIADENCAGAMLDGCGEHLWSKQFVNNGYHAPRIAVDSFGNIAMGGAFNGASGALDVGGGNLKGWGNLFLAKFDSGGNHNWSMILFNGSVGNDLGDIVFDPFGNVLTTGSQNSVFYINKYDPGGDLIWYKGVGGGALKSSYGIGIVTDSIGNIFVAGRFADAIDFGDFGGGTLTSSGNTDVFVVKLDAAGTHVWSKRFGDNLEQGVDAIAIDENGDVAVTGSFYGTMDFGGETLSSAGGSDIYLAKIKSDGAIAWSRSFGGDGYDYCKDVTFDGFGNVIITGYSAGVNFGGDDLVNDGAGLFIAKFDPSSQHIWSNAFGDSDTQIGASIVSTKDGDLVVVGNIQGSIDVGGGVLAGSVLVAKLASDGAHLWSHIYGSDLGQYGRSAAIDFAGNVLLVGEFTGSIDFGGSAMQTSNSVDMFVAKLAP